MEQSKIIDTLETYHPSYEHACGSHLRVSCMLIGLCIGGLEWGIDPGAIGFTSGFSQEHRYSTVGEQITVEQLLHSYEVN